MAWLNFVTAGIQAEGQYQQGRIGAANAELQSIQDRRDANQAQVESQQQAFNERRRAKILRSRALAVAGKSGAGVSDPTVTKITDDISTEGEVRALNALYEGDYMARSLRSGAVSKLRMSNAYQAAGALSAAGTIAGAVPSFYDRYGGSFSSFLARNQNPGRGGGYVNIDPTLEDVNFNQGYVSAPYF